MVAAHFWTLLLLCLGTAELLVSAKPNQAQPPLRAPVVPQPQSGLLPVVPQPQLGQPPLRSPASDVPEPPPQKTSDDTPTVILKRGYPVETHKVVTDDGYILSMHRIPWGKAGNTAEKRTPVLVQHGLLCSSEDWVMSPDGQALAFLLSDAGYDVWLGNYRGNFYSKAHTTFDIKGEDYWKFSWDEMGKYDLPAFWDHILQTTGEDQLFHVGYSMGTTGFWVAMNERPEYNDKIRAMFAMAPVASTDNMKSPLRLIAPFEKMVDWLLDMIGMEEFLPSPLFMSFLGSIACDTHTLFSPICKNALFLIGGFDSDKFNDTMMGTILGSRGRGTSAKTVLHYGQSVNNHKFCKYDYGLAGNEERYGQETPPEYDYSKVTAPVALLWGQNDWLGDPADVMELVSGLPNIMPGGVIRVDFPKWSHLDFLWGIDAKPLVYDHLLDLMSKS